MDINVKGTIISNDDKWFYDWFEMDSTCPRDVLDKLAAAKGEDVDIYINSGGGAVFAGIEIYSAIRAYKGRVKIHVVGLAGSAASVIMCAGESEIEPPAMVMIHNVSAYAEGNYMDMAHMSETLKTASSALCNAYVEKTGRSAEEMQSLMDQEKWFTAQEAVEIGLCDRITGGGLQMMAALSPVVPEQVISGMKTMLEKKKSEWMALGAATARLKRLEEIE